ncbi:MAG: hypothetical protein WCY05_04865 [Candidatus Omnitrophota bacterium]
MGINNINWQAFSERFFTYLNELSSFNFVVSNPVFWLFFSILFLLLLKIWAAKKAFSFCIVIAFVLLAATKIEAHVSRFFIQAEGSFDGILIKIATIVIICIVVLYYSCMKSNY